MKRISGRPAHALPRQRSQELRIAAEEAAGKDALAHQRALAVKVGEKALQIGRALAQGRFEAAPLRRIDHEGRKGERPLARAAVLARP